MVEDKRKATQGFIVGRKVENVKAQEFLKQPRKLDVMIKNKLIEKEQWRTIAMGTTAQMGGERVQTSSSQQKMADAVGKYVDMEKEIDKTIDTLIDTKQDVIAVIERLNPIEYDVLHKRYIQYLTFDEIADSLGVTYSNTTTLHGRAIKSVQKILDARKD